MNDNTILKKIAKALFTIGIALIIMVIGSQIIQRILYEKDKNFILEHFELGECELVEIKSQDEYINTPSGCTSMSPILVLRMNDDIKTEFLACKSIEVAPAFGKSQDIEVDNYSCAHIKKFFDNYKKDTNTTLEIKTDCDSLNYNVETYIKYNDNNKKDLMDFAEKIIKQNEKLPSKYKYEVSINYNCNSNFGCTYKIKDIDELAQNINYKK